MFRLFLAAPIAMFVTGGLFSFMAWMVDNGHHQLPESKETLAFNMVMVEQESEVQRRQRSVPEKPETPEPPPESVPKHTNANSTVTPLTSPIMPSVALDVSVTGMAIQLPAFSDIGKDQQVMPLYRVEPKYPPRAQKRSIEGFVILSFTIDSRGRPTDIQVVDAQPKRIFDREAIRALKSWKYQPKLENGKAVAQPGQSVKVEFNLDKS
ncbi:energy transducer TonB [Photobacterium sp. CCB-ST2H9]|uniref:energy transducer TonB n=1 Tax=Photobacterium sp. CCB-ST2H9 TaxID=2912855 RepID=UPI0020040EFC|nr:energy transducer TonB [Photobacterium sp. CCB-ST2H9]UTM60222.1 energy transducer TonB [Photobacterium sp. CCB-ST2H9]